MKNRVNKKSRLSKELLVWSLVAFFISVMFYVAISTVSIYILENYYSKEENIKKIESMYLNKLQKYIDDNNISINDISKIDEWNEKNDNIYLKLFLDNTLIFDTAYGPIDYKNIHTENVEDFSNMKYHNLKIQGSNVQALMFYGDFPSEVWANYCSIILSFLLFFILLLKSIKNKMLYLIKIKNELDALSKSLDVHITIRGCDEITQVAYGIESLRLSIIDKLSKEKLAHDANMNLVTSLSHDIKTPLTSIITYLELSSERVKNDAKLERYIDITLRRANHLRDLTNQLFEYFLLHSDSRSVTFEMVNSNELVVQMVEENLYDLETKGAHVYREISDITSHLRVNTNLVNRLFNNIFSNLYKYADLNKEISAKYYIKEKYLIISLENYKKEELKKRVSSNIGINNCKAIMEKHCGKFEVMESEYTYSIFLYFLITVNENQK